VIIIRFELIEGNAQHMRFRV